MAALSEVFCLHNNPQDLEQNVIKDTGTDKLPLESWDKGCSTQVDAHQQGRLLSDQGHHSMEGESSCLKILS